VKVWILVTRKLRRRRSKRSNGATKKPLLQMQLMKKNLLTSLEK